MLNTLRGSSGNLVEWYDVYVYTVFATYFESQFFDSADKNSTVYVYAIFAVTFLMRPVGAIVFGAIEAIRGRILEAVPAILGGAALLKADSIVQTLGCIV